MSHKNEDELISIKIRREDNQLARVIASLERMTVQDWLHWMISKAYESSMRNARKTK